MLNAIYVVVSLIILEGLLSFDNALVLAAMVQPLPTHRQKLALRIGIFGAYAMRGISILCVSYLIANAWLKPVGALWLLYLMCSNLGYSEEDENGTDATRTPKITSFFWTVLAIELADMTFSIDNIFAAAAFSPNIYAVFAGVAIGILAMRFVAGLFVDLIKKFPVLEDIGYVLVGYIGVTLAAEYFLGYSINETFKFAGVVSIMAFGIAYERIGFVNRSLTPVFTSLSHVMAWYAAPIDWAKDKVLAAFEGLQPIVTYPCLLAIGIALACVYQSLTAGELTLLGREFDNTMLVMVGTLAATNATTALLLAPRRSR
jgi:tellurite resistance protein TerC